MNYLDLIRPVDMVRLERQFIENDKRTGTTSEILHMPLVKIFTPWAGATWLLSERQPGTSICFGLCDLGLGEPELGYVDLIEVCSVTGPGGVHAEQDLYFEPTKTLTSYAAEARRARRIIT